MNDVVSQGKVCRGGMLTSPALANNHLSRSRMEDSAPCRHVTLSQNMTVLMTLVDIRMLLTCVQI